MLQLGIAGGGAIASVYFDAVRLGAPFRVRALADTDPGVLARRGDESAGLALHSDLTTLLADPEIDALVVALPHNLHAQTVIAALQAGKDVICEKPLGVSLQEAQRVAEVEVHSGRRVVVRCYLRALDHHRWLREMIEDGKLGQVALLRGLFASDRRAALHNPTDWHGDWCRAGGGVMIDAGYHLVDLARHLLGEVDSVSAEMRCTHDGGHSGEDICTLTLRHSAGALTAAAFVWSDDLRPFRWEREVYGTAGVAFVSDANERSDLEARLGGDCPVRRTVEDWWSETNRRAVLDCVAALGPQGMFGGAAVACAEATRSLRLVLAAYLSAECKDSLAPTAVPAEYRPGRASVAEMAGQHKEDT